MRERPDYFGSWMLPDDLEQQRIRIDAGSCASEEEYQLLAELGMGSFLMFIDSRERQRDIEKIFGRIMDSPVNGFVESLFEGELGSDFIRFTKRYPKRFVAMGFPEEIPYEGKKVGDKFRGTYHMPTNWDGQFFLRKYRSKSDN